VYSLLVLYLCINKFYIKKRQFSQFSYVENFVHLADFQVTLMVMGNSENSHVFNFEKLTFVIYSRTCVC